ncbi:zinc-binding dehydrogenase [Rhizobacter sp. LjRoot28]|uniref:zinc-binding dehydrogenase n=1 Tax=Rhizobacter sp. LjRoot28 TaxID=3342309 RepID=UPI003ED0EAE4
MTPRTALQLQSLVRPTGELVVSLAEVAVPEPGPNEVLVRIEASPLNPSDLGLLFGAADLTQLRATGTAGQPQVTAPVPENGMRAMAARIGEAMPVGNEGAGTVVAAGSSASAQALMGRTVAILGGGMYAQYRCVPVDQCLPLPEGASAADGASAFVNPLTALGMTETMRREGHTALVHTAAASNLGQMLNRICQKDGIALVNIVRRPEQVALLKDMGAEHVCDASTPDFMASLTDALTATGATIAFDAIGGGRVAGQILTCMEAAINRKAKNYSRYGSDVHKQVYVYGSLDMRPTEFVRNFGMTWSMGGWLLTPFLQKIGPVAAQALRQRVAAELTTTFKSHYAREISLSEALDPDVIAEYGRRATGAKFLINPSRG